MKDRKRALRRHHRGRMIRRALRSYVIQATWNADAEERRRIALRWYNNLAKCSCSMCGNPRKFDGLLTTQERRFHEAARYELAEFADLLRHN